MFFVLIWNREVHLWLIIDVFIVFVQSLLISDVSSVYLFN